MKIVMIGKGEIGSHIAREVEGMGALIAASRTCQEYPIDIKQEESIENFFNRIGNYDHLLLVAGVTHMAPFQKLTNEQISSSIASKLIGQINCVRIGMRKINKGGSIVLTTGCLSHLPLKNFSMAALVNAALERFVVNVALEMQGFFRINAASPALLKESKEKYKSELFNDFPVVLGKEVAKAYRHLIESTLTGTVMRIGWSVEQLKAERMGA